MTPEGFPRRPRDRQRTLRPCVIIRRVIERPAASEPYGIMEATDLDGWVLVDAERYRPSDNLILWGDRTRIERELGWKPEIPLEQTLADLLDYWRKEVR